ncbi:MAG: TRAP transporter substrate-binding protein [Granulosicoccaceae bacterium]
MKYRNLITASLLAVSALVSGQATAVETLTIHHFLSPKAPPHKNLLQYWANQVEEQSNGELKVEIFPSMSMGGKPPELYRQVRDGVADLVWTVTGYTPGVFPRSEVFELPTVHEGSALATNLAIQDTMELMEEDFKDVKLILLHVHQGNALHMASKKITTADDLRGLKLRTPSRTGAWTIESWGAEPVGMPVPALPQALSKGAVEGALLSFEIVPALKLQELTDYSHEAANHGRFGTAVFMFAMNKERFESLPENLQSVINANSGDALAGLMGQIWEDGENPGISMQEKSGGEVLQLSDELTAELETKGQIVVDRWVKEANGAGIDGQALVDAARAAVATHTK